MTVFTLIRELARDWGITTFTPANAGGNVNRNGPSAGDMESLVFGLNSALEDIWHHAPAALFMQPFGAYLNAPTSVSLTVTQGSRTVAITTWAAWMEGCTVRISGETSDNEILSQTGLARAYSGTTGTVAGTVYADCVPFIESVLAGSSGIAQVLPPVRVAGRELELSASRRDFYFQSGMLDAWYPTLGITIPSCQKRTGVPTVYFPENVNLGTGYSTHLRLCPMPDSVQGIEWNAHMKPTAYAVSDIYQGTDYNTDVGTAIVLPFSFLILKSVARKWLSGDMRGINSANRDEIDRQYKAAIMSLGEIVPSGITAGIGNSMPTFRGSLINSIYRGR